VWQSFELTDAEYEAYKRHGYIGKVMGAHTNLTEIKEALDLMWRAGVDPSRVVMGMGFYGRTFTIADETCVTPGCPFSTGGEAGPCTGTSGVLSYKGESETCFVLEAHADNQ
jgi:GH18 family chitinase